MVGTMTEPVARARRTGPNGILMALSKKGTKLTTSGIDRSAFPASIPLGVIAQTKPAADGLTLDLVVTPYADLSELSFVTVLLWEGAAP